MMDPEIRREIKREVRNAINLILNCDLGASTNEDQEIGQVFPGAPKLDKRPVVHPFGLVSRAPQGKLGVTAQVGEHPGARIIIGVRDSARAEIALEEGEACLYNAFGEKIFLLNGKIAIGSIDADEPNVLGNVLVELLTEILNIIKAGNIGLTTSPGNPTAPNPAITPQVDALISEYLTTAATNIVSGKSFTER